MTQHDPVGAFGLLLVDQASNGEDGLEKIRLHRPDIVFTDIKMPKMDGLQMIEEAVQGRSSIFIITERL